MKRVNVCKVKVQWAVVKAKIKGIKGTKKIYGMNSGYWKEVHVKNMSAFRQKQSVKKKMPVKNS